MSAALLEARDVTHSFGGKFVLQDVQIGLEAGRLLVVLGPNGSGKTTLVRILSGVLQAHSARIRLQGRELEGLSRREIARSVAVVPQETYVPFPFRVREMVAMGRAPHLGALGREGPHDLEVTELALRALGLEEMAERSFPTLSGGEKQRAILARAFAQEAALLLLDEPTAHMDLGHRVHTFEWLRAWLADQPEQRGALLVTHDLILASRFADVVVLLDRGRIVAQGAPPEVLTRERISEVYGVEATVSQDSTGRPVIVAERSQIGYIGRPHGPDR